MLPDGSRLHVVIPDITRDALVRQHPQVRRPGRPPRRPGRARHADRAGGARSSTRPSRRASTSSSPAAPRPARRPCSTASPPRSRRASGSSPARRSSSCRSRCATWPSMQCRQPSLEGTGEIPLRRLVKEALRMRPSPDHRRRGAPGREPRPAHRPELAACRACARSTPTAPARRSPRCARCRCWPARTSAAGSSCRPSPARSTSSSTPPWSTTASRRVREIVAVPGRVEGDVVETADLFVHRGRAAGPGRRLPAAPGPLPPRRVRPRRPAGAGRPTSDRASCVGLLLGRGAVLHLVVLLGAREPRGRGAAAPLVAAAARRAGPGRATSRSTPRSLLAPACIAFAVVVFLVVVAIDRRAADRALLRG